MLGCKVESVEPEKLITSQGEVDFDRLLIAAGRKPNLNGFGLENLSPEYNGKNIKVDSHMETSVKGLYACGDVTGFTMLAHTAEREAAVAANNI